MATPHSSGTPTNLTCITCRLTFDDTDKMRLHYKSEFHRFNLKRKVAGLMPVPEAIFTQKLAEMRGGVKVEPKGQHHLKKGKKPKATPSQTNQTSQAKPEPETIRVPSRQAEKTEDELIDEKIETSVKLSLEHSLFDRHVAKDFELNLEYMTRTYRFFIPEIEYLKDLKGLIHYLGEKISIGNTCIWCEKTFYSMDAVQAHMRDLSHCKIRWEDNEDEYANFYDLEAADKRFPVWLDEDPAEAPQTEEPQAQEDEDVKRIYVNNNNELVLVDKNKSLGHRSLQLFYKQRAHSADRQLITSLLQEHKRLAALHHQRETNQDHEYIQKQRKYELQNGIKGNKQKHFRSQNPV